MNDSAHIDTIPIEHNEGFESPLSDEQLRDVAVATLATGGAVGIAAIALKALRLLIW